MIGLGSDKNVDFVDFQSTLPDFGGCQIIAKISDKLDWQMKDISKRQYWSHILEIHAHLERISLHDLFTGEKFEMVYFEQN